MRQLVLLGFAALLALAVHPVTAQDAPVRGVVWTPPANVRQAERELRDMHASGVEAVRTSPVRRERLLAVADTLGLQLYQDLPIAYLSARALRDTMDYVQRQLAQLLGRAQRHPSARHFGLARLSDTSEASACAYFQQLAALVRQQGPQGSRTYYVTAFQAADQCGRVVDLVLIDARNADAPARRLAARQRTESAAPIGIGALGTWVRSDGRSGLRVPYSPEEQARYLERHLTHLLADTVSAAPSVVFVYRWNDGRGMHDDPFGRLYGLHAEDGTPRPAAHVVTGLFTGEQTVFAFPAGNPPAGPGPWLILLGWGLIAALAVVYFSEPRVRHTVIRYFLAHRFYQEAIEQGREVLPGSSLSLLSASALGIGALGAVLGRCFHDAQSVVWALHALPEALQPGVAALLHQPWLLGLVLGTMYAASLVLWIQLIVLVGQWRASVSIGQAVMVVGWPRWPMLLVLVAAMVISSLPVEMGRSLVLMLITATGGLAVWMTGRTVADLAAIARIPWTVATATALVSPIPLLLVAGLVLINKYGVPMTFIWHLLARP